MEPLNSTDRERIDELMRAMTVEEKIGQLNMLSADGAVTGPVLKADFLADVRGGHCGSLLNLWGAERVRAAQRIAREETRLGIPLLFGFDILHGLHTVFPVPLAEAGAFDPELWRGTAAAQAEEAMADGISLVFSPMLDVARDPRWGRGMEGPGESVLVAGRMAVAKIAGYQGAGHEGTGRPPAACAKHLAAYGAVLAGREYASVDVSDRELFEIYLPPFRRAIEAGVATIMPAFHDLGGVPMTANRAILRDLVRDRWGFTGVMVSDYGAVAELLAHGVARDPAEAAALALEAGVDIDMMGEAYRHGLPEALARGLVAPERLDEAAYRVLVLKAGLGLFAEPPHPAPPEVDRAAHRTLSRRAACRSAVLLTHRSRVLPIPRDIAHIALIGPYAQARGDLNGPWAGVADPAATVSFQQGLGELWGEARIEASAGCRFDAADQALLAEALAVAARADRVVLCLGEPADWSGEAASRTDLELPAAQRHLADVVLALGRPTILVLCAGRPLILGDLAERCDAILMLWFPGAEGGRALADMLSGAAPPSGRLPVSWPIHQGQIPIYHDRRPTGRPSRAETKYSARYIDCPTEPLFPFGHGESYAPFSYGAPEIDRGVIGPGERVTVRVAVTNGGTSGDRATLFLFIRDPVARAARPLLELKDFQTVEIGAGATTTVRLGLAAADLGLAVPPDAAPELEHGAIEIWVGPSADPARLRRVMIEVRTGDGVVRA